MLSSASFLRTACSGSFDNNGVKTPTRIVPMSPQKSPAILPQVDYVTLWSCGIEDCVESCGFHELSFGENALAPTSTVVVLLTAFLDYARPRLSPNGSFDALAAARKKDPPQARSGREPDQGIRARFHFRRHGGDLRHGA